MKCKKHPTYKALRKPRAKCFACQIMWAKKQRRKPMRLKDVEFQLSWAKYRAEQIDIEFKRKSSLILAWIKDVGCKGAGLRTEMGDMLALYDNYHALLYVADMIENGRP